MTISRRDVLKTGLGVAAALATPRGLRAQQSTILNDASRLSPTTVQRHVTLRSPTSDELVASLRSELKAATEANRPFALATARHSMGGQSLPRDGTAVTLDGGPVELDREKQIYRVGAGARWRDVIRALDPHGFSPAVMQSNHDFGVGSTFCVNAHGWPAPYGPFGSTVRAVRLMLADGSLVNCSRSENAELFGLAMAGYGLLGIVVELDVEMEPNEMLVPSFQKMPAGQFALRFVEAIERNPDLRMAYGRLSVARRNFLTDALLVTYERAAQQPDLLPAPAVPKAVTSIQRQIYRSQIGSEFGKRARWTLESQFAPVLGGRVTRNALINQPVANLANADRARTDILHEYFVSPDRFDDFLAACRDLIPAAKAEFLNVTLRYVGADDTPVMGFSRGSKRIAAVMSFSQQVSKEGEADMQSFTERLIDRVTAIGGSFYLPYRLHARRDQVEKAYPRVAEFVAAKRRFDPELRFRNLMWDSYFA